MTLSDLREKIWTLIARGRLSARNRDKAMRTIQCELLAGDVRDDVEHFEPYGFTSEPHLGAEPLTLSLDGERRHTIAVCVADRRYRMTGLKDGEVAIFDDQGQHVHLTRSGIKVVTSKTLTMKAAGGTTLETPTFTVNASKGITLNTPLVKASDDLTASGVSLPKHVHGGVQSGSSNTGGPH